MVKVLAIGHARSGVRWEHVAPKRKRCMVKVVEEEAMTTAIIGVGKIGNALARHLVRSGEQVVLAARNDSNAQALANELGELASAAFVPSSVHPEASSFARDRAQHSEAADTDQRYSPECVEGEFCELRL